MMILDLPTLGSVEAARRRMAGYILRTPLIRVNGHDRSSQIYLKSENLQPIGSFKIRPALNALLSLPADQLKQGVCTVSSGNFACGIAWAAQQVGVRMATYMYDGALPVKVDAVRRLGGEVRFVSAERWWRLICELEAPQGKEVFIHPVLNPAVLAANGTIALEILEDLPDVECVLLPYGGGSLAVGVGNVFKQKRPLVKIIAVEAEHAAPLTAAIAAGRPVSVEVRPSQIQSIGGPSVLDGIWPLVMRVVDRALVMETDKLGDALRKTFLDARMVVELAGSAALAAALSGRTGGGRTVCIASGGNIDAADFVSLLQGRLPTPPLH
jgi:threonine dehydratase